MNAHLVCNTAFTILLLRPTPLRALAAGLIGSLALVLHNPVPHLLFAVPWICWLAVRDNRLRIVPALAAGYLPLSVALGIGWPQLISQLSDPGPASTIAAIGSASFVEVWLGRLMQTFRLPGLDLLEDRLMSLAKLWLWAAPGLLLLAVCGLRAVTADVRYRLIAWSAATTLLGFLFVPFDQGHGWGFRYFHSVWFALPVLASAQFLTHRAPGAESGPSARKARSLLPFAAACALLSLVVLTPFRIWQVERFVAGHLAQIPRLRQARQRWFWCNGARATTQWISCKMIRSCAGDRSS